MASKPLQFNPVNLALWCPRCNASPPTLPNENCQGDHGTISWIQQYTQLLHHCRGCKGTFCNTHIIKVESIWCPTCGEFNEGFPRHRPLLCTRCHRELFARYIPKRIIKGILLYILIVVFMLWNIHSIWIMAVGFVLLYLI